MSDLAASTADTAPPAIRPWWERLLFGDAVVMALGLGAACAATVAIQHDRSVMEFDLRRDPVMAMVMVSGLTSWLPLCALVWARRLARHGWHRRTWIPLVVMLGCSSAALLTSVLAARRFGIVALW